MQGAKHPRIAINACGETLVVWTDGIARQKDGSLVRQVFDPNGEPTAVQGRRDGVPLWSYATAYARGDASFLILH